ncbi:MAG: DUF4013 domain-containing protein [Planctomycetes bacterium]|nr:DUF4013 domain-containing protein [Planctomycetota bacterium]
MTLHPHVAGLLPVLDPRWRAKIFRGGLLLCLPFVGWPAVLGYRARFVRHLFAPEAAALPDWREGFWGFVRDGLWAMTVIFGYLAPLYAMVAWLAIGRGYLPGMGALGLTLGFAAFPIFSTLSFPVAVTLLLRDGWLHGGECASALAVWALLIFLVPAGFLQVTLKGRHRHAFAVWRTVPFVVRNLRAYAAAWWYSGLMSLCGHLCLPLALSGVTLFRSVVATLFRRNNVTMATRRSLCAGV